MFKILPFILMKYHDNLSRSSSVLTLKNDTFANFIKNPPVWKSNISFKERHFADMGANMGTLPPEYNKAVHGPYDPAIYYGKKVQFIKLSYVWTFLEIYPYLEGRAPGRCETEASWRLVWAEEQVTQRYCRCYEQVSRSQGSSSSVDSHGFP